MKAFQEEPTAFSALRYDAVQLLVIALKSAKDTEPESIVEALEDIHDFAGVSGRISYGKDSRIPLKPVTIMEVRNGVQQQITEFVPERVPTP